MLTAGLSGGVAAALADDDDSFALQGPLLDDKIDLGAVDTVEGGGPPVAVAAAAIQTKQMILNVRVQGVSSNDSSDMMQIDRLYAAYAACFGEHGSSV